MTLKRKTIGRMFGTFAALQKIRTIKAKKKKNLNCFHGCGKEQVVCY